jgi:hypothetical protein
VVGKMAILAETKQKAASAVAKSRLNWYYQFNRLLGQQQVDSPAMCLQHIAGLFYLALY